MAKRKASSWVAVFEDFAKDVRIRSKEIADPDGTGSPLVLWQSQRIFLRELGTGLDAGQRIFKNLKGRQQGITTISLLLVDCFWPAMNPGLTMAHVTDNETNRDANRAIIRSYIQSFPEGYFEGQFDIVTDNRNSMVFSNSSRINFLVAGTKNKGLSWAEGQGYAAAHLTEVSKYGSKEALDSFKEAFAQENPNRLFVFESTANGFNLWHDEIKEAKANHETQRSWFTGWWAADPNRIDRSDPRWLQWGMHAPTGDEHERMRLVRDLYGVTITPEQLCWIRWRTEKEGDSEILRQNQPWTEDEAWVMSGFSFFPTRQLAKDYKLIDEDEGDTYDYLAYRYHLGNSFLEMKLEPITDPAEADEIELRVWEEPVAGARYAIGADPAWGRNEHKDRHGLEVYRCFADKMVQVAEYATNNCEAKQFAWVLAHMAGAYQNCIVNIDLQGPGNMLMLEWEHLLGLLHSEAYADQVRSREWEDALGLARWYLYHRPDAPGPGYSANFLTTARTKAEIMHQMKGSYLTHELMIRSKRLLEEMRNVIQDGDSIAAPETTSEDGKDDRVFASALAIRAWINWIRPSMLSEGLLYDFVMASERSDPGHLGNRLNAIVGRFLLTAQERAMEVETRPTWLTARNL